MVNCMTFFVIDRLDLSLYESILNLRPPYPVKTGKYKVDHKVFINSFITVFLSLFGD